MSWVLDADTTPAKPVRRHKQRNPVLEALAVKEESELRARAVRLIARNATSPEDCALLCMALGLNPREGLATCDTTTDTQTARRRPTRSATPRTRGGSTRC